MGLLPGKSFYLSDVKVTKQKGFGSFDVAAYWSRKYRKKEEDKGWYFLIVVGVIFKDFLSGQSCELTRYGFRW